jgi:hypothetical protein
LATPPEATVVLVGVPAVGPVVDKVVTVVLVPVLTVLAITGVVVPAVGSEAVAVHTLVDAPLVQVPAAAGHGAGWPPQLSDPIDEPEDTLAVSEKTGVAGDKPPTGPATPLTMLCVVVWFAV